MLWGVGAVPGCSVRVRDSRVVRKAQHRQWLDFLRLEMRVSRPRRVTVGHVHVALRKCLFTFLRCIALECSRFDWCGPQEKLA